MSEMTLAVTFPLALVATPETKALHPVLAGSLSGAAVEAWSTRL